jgi:hypothetical protein
VWLGRVCIECDHDIVVKRDFAHQRISHNPSDLIRFYLCNFLNAGANLATSKKIRYSTERSRRRHPTTILFFFLQLSLHQHLQFCNYSSAKAICTRSLSVASTTPYRKGVCDLDGKATETLSFLLFRFQLPSPAPPWPCMHEHTKKKL